MDDSLENEVAAAVRAQTGAPSAPAPTGSIVRTFEGDLAEAIREKKGSVVKIAVAEDARRREEGGLRPSETDTPSRTPLIFAALFLVLGLVALVGAYFFYLRPGAGTGGTGETTLAPSLIASDTRKDLSLDTLPGTQLRDALVAEAARQDLRLDSIEEVRLTDHGNGTLERVSADRFFTALGTRIPNVLLRSLRPEFMYGIHAFNGNDPFIIMKTDFYENAFLGLLKWEDTMALDLFSIFNIPIDNAHRPLLEKPFVDAVVKNMDARVLLDDRGQAVLIYAIPDRSTIVITRTPDTLTEVISRLAAPTVR